MSIPHPRNGSVPARMLGRGSARAAFGSTLDLEVGGAELAERLPQGGLGFTEPSLQAGDEGVEGVDGEHGLCELGLRGGEVDCGQLVHAHGVVGEHDRCRRSRSEEHTAELPSLMRISYAVFCLKNKK